MPSRIENVNGGAKDKVLLVEGRDERFVIKTLCEQKECQDLKFDIREEGGFEGIKKAVKPMLLRGSESLTRLGLIADADENPIETRWQSFSDILKSSGFDLPDSPLESGTFSENGNQKIGIWIMPNNKDNGMLEDFLLDFADSNGRDAAEAYIDDSIKSGVAKLNPKHRSKGIARAYLAIQKKPSQSLGTAITSKAFKVDAKLAKSFTNWLTRLFKSDF